VNADTDPLTLVTPTAELEKEFVSMAAEYLAAGDTRYSEAIENFDMFMGRLADAADEQPRRVGRMVTKTFWFVRGDKHLLGCSRLRRELTAELEHEGHIGYDIRPSERGKGYGTRLLAMALEQARRMSWTRVLVTCRPDNVASSRVIEKNGGVFSGQTTNTHTGNPVNLYWIDLKGEGKKTR